MTSKEVKREVKRKPELPPVSEMVIESIMALKDPPRKGSTLRAIKETIGLNWPVKEASLYYLLGLTSQTYHLFCGQLRSLHLTHNYAAGSDSLSASYPVEPTLMEANVLLGRVCQG